jgi:hypothetical protein
LFWNRRWISICIWDTRRPWQLVTVRGYGWHRSCRDMHPSMKDGLIQLQTVWSVSNEERW